ncbi:MAG: DUF2628 domain-containing protein [Eubacterium sp.]|nr:DUF2628 domain-containing protein [Eubacterium sp.]
MSIFKDQSCPVCKRLFEEGDDIVYCPDCGTPHHRECYNLIGHCVNRGLHPSGYSYYDEHREEIRNTEANRKLRERFHFSEEEDTDAKAGPAGEQNDGARGFTPFGAPDLSAFTRTPYDSDTYTVNGESLGDIASTVRTNTARFISVFKAQEQSGKKLGWNWGAFIFGMYYFFFRKMYKQAITLFCINISLSSLLTFLSMKLAPLTYNAISGLATMNPMSNQNELLNRLNEIQGMADFQKFSMIVFAVFALKLIVALGCALLADYSYKMTVTSFIKSVNEQLENGAEFNASAGGDPLEASLDRDGIKRLYLAKKGGTTILAPIAAYIVLDLISMLL